MCLFTYTFHACGHTTYDFAEPTLPCCTSTRPCETPTLDNEGEDLLTSSTVLASTCNQCAKSISSTPASPSSPKPKKEAADPYLKNLHGIADVLEVALIKLDYGDPESWSAFQAVKLLSRMAAVYDICGERKPSREEMRRYIVQVVGKVDTARYASLIHEEARVKNVEDVDGDLSDEGGIRLPRLSTIEEGSCSSEPCSPTSSVMTNPFFSSCPSLALTSSPEEKEELSFSEGTVERQLFPQAISIPSYPLATSHERERDVVDMMRDMRLQPFLYFSPKAGTLEEASESEGSIVTDPFLVKEEKLGRDAWECDFCGLECLCKGFDD